MTGMNDQQSAPASSIANLWKRMPVVLKAIVVGFIVFAIVGSVTWTAISILIPPPLSLLITAIVLWVYLRYFSGSWWPKTTSEYRRVHFRATKLSKRVWAWSLLAALFAVFIFQSSLMIAFRIIEFPSEAWDLGIDFSTVPVWQGWLFILTAAVVAGVTEEVGFRGYMQVPIEDRFGPTVGIAIVSMVFVAAHLNQAWSGSILVILFAISVVWGILARVSGSLIPVMISHTVTDIFNFSYWWTDVLGTFDKRPIAETGLDAHFIVWVLVLVASVLLFAFVSRKTLDARGGI